MKTELRRKNFFILPMCLAALLAFTALGCDGERLPGGCDGGGSNAYPTPTPEPGETPDPTPDPNEPDVFEPIDTGPGGSIYTDSAHFRVYSNSSSVNLTLAHLEAAYKCFVTDMGFRSTGLSTREDGYYSDGYYKMNVYPKTMSAGGLQKYDSTKGFAYLDVNRYYITDPKIFVHEYGHAISVHEIKWMYDNNTGAWWETVANWVADTYINSSYYEEVRQRYGLAAGGTLIDLNRNINMSYLTIVHDQNYYQAWPFLTYLTNNPDNYPGLGKTTVVNLNRYYDDGSDETPLHTLERLSSVPVQTILGRYWARMAYLDIGHSTAQQVFFNTRRSLDFSNLTSIGNQTYQVKAARKPMYGGANIIPLNVSGNTVSVKVTNLGNGRSDSNFTATLSIRSSNGSVRYVELPNGSGQAAVGSSEEASLVVVNTPDNLIKYSAFNSTAYSPECIGLNYQVYITGATPTN